jgi:hypothetical protein
MTISPFSPLRNVPIIGYMAARSPLPFSRPQFIVSLPLSLHSNIFSDKSIYKTLARVSLRTTNSLAMAVYSLVHHYNWNRVWLGKREGNLH